MSGGVYRVLVAAYPGEVHSALLCAGVLSEYYIHRPAAPDGLGDIYVGRVTAIVPAMAGAFVALPDAEAFLPDTEGGAALTAGAHVTVVVTRAAQGGKGPRVRLHVGGPMGAGPVRLVCLGPTPLEELQAAYPTAAKNTGAFDEAVQAEIELLGASGFALPGGMTATAVPTPALTAIDVDGGSGTAVRAGKAVAQFAANAAAIPELARQIRLRNFGGAVLIDFAGMPAKKRAALQVPLRAALAADRVGPRLAGFTALGFAEILRPRLRPPLHEKLRGPLAAGLLALRDVAARSAAAPAVRLVLRAPPPVISALQADPAALTELAHVMAHPLALRSDPGLPGNATLIEPVDA